MSINENDNDLASFLTYLITGLTRAEGVGEAVGENALRMIQSSQSPSAVAVLTSLINDLAALDFGIIYVLDDYHLIEEEAVHQALAFLLNICRRTYPS